MQIRFSLAIAGLILTSCVSQRRFDRVNTEVSQLRNERDEVMKKAESSKLEVLRLDKENKALIDENGKLKLDSTNSGMMYRKNKQLLTDLFDKYDRLDKSYNSLLSNSNSERGFTEKELKRKEDDLARREKELAEAKAQMAQTQQDLQKKNDEASKLSQEVGNKDTKIKQMESTLAAKDKAMADIKEKMAAALLTLNNANLEVKEKNGKIYVVLPNQTLFSSGSYRLQPEGKKAITQVAGVLIQNTELEISVEGHTDNTPFKPSSPKTKKGAKPAPATTSTVKDNWDLSSLRAATVARELYALGVAGDRISAAGKGEFYPLDFSNSEIAKARNRRIEIVISPKLAGLYDMLNGGEKK